MSDFETKGDRIRHGRSVVVLDGSFRLGRERAGLVKKGKLQHHPFAEEAADTDTLCINTSRGRTHLLRVDAVPIGYTPIRDLVSFEDEETLDNISILEQER